MNSSGTSLQQAMPVWVINLNRSVDRWDHMQRMLARADIRNYARVDAVDGKLLDQETIRFYYDEALNKKNYFVPLKSAEIACFLSHRKAWTTFLESAEPMLCILEDDVEFVGSPQLLLQRVKDELTNTQPKLIKIYASRSVTGPGFFFRKPAGIRLDNPITVPLGTQGYCLNRLAAEKLLKFSARFFEPVDVALQQWWIHGVKTSVIQPNALKELSSSLGGTTLHSQSKKSLWMRLRRELMRPLFRLNRRLRSFAAWLCC